MSDPASEPNTADGDSEETTVAPSEAQTGAVDLAWSAVDTAPDVEAFIDGRRPLPKTLLAFLAGVVVAAVALGAFALGQREPTQENTAPTQPTSTAPSSTPSMALGPPPSATPQPTSTPTSAAPPAPTPATAPPEPTPTATAAPSPSAQRPMSPEDTFIAQLQADGITFDSPALAVRAANKVCFEFSLGNSEPDIAAAVKADNPSLSDTRAADFVSLSANAYCPQYGSST
jgi:type IV secretory pathway VirB10-like protein